MHVCMILAVSVYCIQIDTYAVIYLVLPGRARVTNCQMAECMYLMEGEGQCACYELMSCGERMRNEEANGCFMAD